MYKVFVNDRLLILTNKRPDDANGNIFSLDPKSIIEAIKQLNNKKLKEAYIFKKGDDKLLKKFKKALPVVQAGGGKVRNKKGKVLFIYRNGKWDLPKGKLDKGESFKEAAIREVEEETGVKGLKCKDLLATTYHIFRRNGTYKLKEVKWYDMVTDYNGKLKAERSEGITKVRWKGSRKTKKALEKSYTNIKLLFED